MAKGWIKVERSILETDWYKDLATRVLWLHLQLTLGFTDTDELVTTISTLSKETGLSVQQVRSAIRKMVDNKQITNKTTNKNTRISLYSSVLSNDLESEATNKITNKQHTGKKEEKERTKEKEERILEEKEKIYKKENFGLYGNVELSPLQMEKLQQEFPNDYQERIQRVDDYCQSYGKKYKDYLAVIRTWARRDGEKQKTYQRPEVGVPVYEPYVEGGLDTDTQKIMEETLKKLKNV